MRIETKRDETRRQIEVVVERTVRTDASLSLDSRARRGGIRDFVSTRRRRRRRRRWGRRARARVEVERVAGREARAESRARFGCLSLFERARSVQTNRR